MFRSIELPLRFEIKDQMWEVVRFCYKLSQLFQAHLYYDCCKFLTRIDFIEYLALTNDCCLCFAVVGLQHIDDPYMALSLHEVVLEKVG